MELDPTMIWNLVLTLIVAPFAWAFSKMFQEVKRLQILLNLTREEYAKRSDVQLEVKEVISRGEAHMTRMPPIRKMAIYMPRSWIGYHSNSKPL